MNECRKTEPNHGRMIHSDFFPSLSNLLSFANDKSFLHVSDTYFDMISLTFNEIIWTVGHIPAPGGIRH
jgi:hypothetical protein